MNQTTQMHQIAEELREYDCWFGQLFTDNPLINALIRSTSLMDGTILAGRFKAVSEKYLAEHRLQMDYRAKKNDYDLVLYCADMFIPARLRGIKTVWVQEGMTDRYTLLSRVVRALRLPPILTGGTSLNGCSDLCDVYCAASEGYKTQFSSRGTSKDKIIVTGIPNYDHIAQYCCNDFPHRGYVMVATTDMRETGRFEDREVFIRKPIMIAGGRRLLFKLHPNERTGRAMAEIRRIAPPGTLIYADGNTNHMIANCAELVTQYSTVVYTGMVLGKKVHSYFDLGLLEALVPIQNGGRSAFNIANVCRNYLESSTISMLARKPALIFKKGKATGKLRVNLRTNALVRETFTFPEEN